LRWFALSTTASTRAEKKQGTRKSVEELGTGKRKCSHKEKKATCQEKNHVDRPAKRKKITAQGIAWEKEDPEGVLYCLGEVIH